MLKVSEFTVAGKVNDLARWGGKLWAIVTEAGLLALADQTAEQWTSEAEHLVPGDDRALVLGPRLDQQMRRVHLLDGSTPVDLGTNRLDYWERTFGGDCWLAVAGHEILLYRVDRCGLSVLHRHETFLPTSVSRCKRGIWVETTSIGASHFELLSEQLKLCEQGDLPNPPMQFPPESIQYCERNPDLPQPLFAIHASHFVRSLKDGRMIHHPVRDRHRLVNLDGRRWTELKGRPRGLQVARGLVLLWSDLNQGTRLDLFWLDSGEKFGSYFLPESREVVARISGSDVLVGDEHGRILVLH